ncbi:MAG: hypothetical protein K6U87_06055 [Firmicutes bacterium]|nr:hypothetical protein [Bacillota bacterium]
MPRRLFFLDVRRRDGGPVLPAWHRAVGEEAVRHPDVVAFSVVGPLDVSDPDAGWRYEITAAGAAGRRPAVALAAILREALPGAEVTWHPAVGEMR